MNITKTYAHSVIRLESAKLTFGGHIELVFVEAIPTFDGYWHFIQTEMFTLVYRDYTQFDSNPMLQPYRQAADALWNVRDALYNSFIAAQQ
jgi:hypothetical protein